MYMYIYIYIYIYMLELCDKCCFYGIPSSADNQTCNYDIDCSNHHHSNHCKVLGMSHSKKKQ